MWRDEFLDNTGCEARPLRKTIKQNRCKSTTCGDFDFIYIQKHIQIAGQSKTHTDASVSWKIKRREDNITSFHRR